MKDRYYKHLNLKEVGPGGQRKIEWSKVLVVGAGGLGSPILLYLAAAGVGHIGIADDDVVEESNLQRQILYGQADVGKAKTKQAREKLQKQYPATQISLHPKLSDDNAEEIISVYDLVIDATDNHTARLLTDRACKKLGKVWIYGSVSGFSLQVASFTPNSPMRYADLFPEAPEQDLEQEGLLSSLPGIAGSIQATEALKIISGAGKPLTGKLLAVNMATIEVDLLEME